MSSVIFVSCEVCGENLERFPSQLKGRKFGTFCSRECLGIFRSKNLTGEFAANYKLGSKKSRHYIEVEAKWHPFANAKGYVSLHRLVAEAYLGRFLQSNEIVHHIDGNHRNNHWSNLSVMTQSDHATIHNNERERDAVTGRFNRSAG